MTHGRAYYNEIDPQAAEWLRQLIAGGHIAPGDVDERSIADVGAAELVGYAQCHFFAGIGGWSYALRLAGWPDDREVWTGSCPCQPFSSIGRGRGTEDPRHLWPQFRRLIAELLPAICFGEQVAGPAGRLWLSGVRSDLEDMGYQVGAADLCAAGVGAPHIRQRLYWVGNTKQPRLEGHARNEHNGNQSGWIVAESLGSATAAGDVGYWSRCNLVGCKDGTTRRAEPESFPLAYGVSGRVGLLRGYGNAIVPQVAAEFIRASREVKQAIEKERTS